MAKQKKQDSFVTPNQKFDEEFGEIDQASNSSTQKSKTQNNNYKTPNEKFDEEFKEHN